MLFTFVTISNAFGLNTIDLLYFSTGTGVGLFGVILNPIDFIANPINFIIIPLDFTTITNAFIIKNKTLL